MKKNAFTLAEVLITLGIIGVVSAMTLPALNSSVSNKQLETATLRAYNMVQNAFSKYMADNEIDNIRYSAAFSGNQQDAEDFVEKYFKVNLKCDSGRDCFVSEYKDLNNSIVTDVYSVNKVAYQLDNGMSIQFKGNGLFIIDINGPKKPNTVDKDLWLWWVQDDGTISDCHNSTSKEDIEANFKSCKAGNAGYGCFAHFMINGFKFDY